MPNCQTNLVIALHASLSILFCHFISNTAYHWADTSLLLKCSITWMFIIVILTLWNWNILSIDWILILQQNKTIHKRVHCFFKNGPFQASFSLFSPFQYTVVSKQMFFINKFLPMTGFEPRTSGIGSDRSTNWATTTSLKRVHCWSVRIEHGPNNDWMIDAFTKRKRVQRGIFRLCAK